MKDAEKIHPRSDFASRIVSAFMSMPFIHIYNRYASISFSIFILVLVFLHQLPNIMRSRYPMSSNLSFPFVLRSCIITYVTRLTVLLNTIFCLLPHDEQYVRHLKSHMLFFNHVDFLSIKFIVLDIENFRNIINIIPEIINEG